MNILCLETTTNTCSVALCTSKGTYEKNVDEGLRHSAVITLFIQDVLQKSDITISQLDAIAVSKGPGSYTGLRVAYSTAKAICFAQDIPLLEIDTLQAAAQMHLHEADRVISMIDARRMEVYYSIWGTEGNVIQPTSNLIIDNPFDLTDLSSQKTILCGDGAQKAIDYWSDERLILGQTILRAKHMLPLAIDQYQKQEFSDVAYAIPYYFKAPKITKSNKLLI